MPRPKPNPARIQTPLRVHPHLMKGVDVYAMALQRSRNSVIEEAIGFFLVRHSDFRAPPPAPKPDITISPAQVTLTANRRVVLGYDSITGAPIYEQHAKKAGKGR